jgi:hypothetical protein
MAYWLEICITNIKLLKNEGIKKMYKKMGIAGIFAGILLASTAANAIPIVDTIDQNIFLQTGDVYSYTHNLLDDGFNLGSATSGTIAVQLFDDADAAWEVILIAVDKFDFDTDSFSISTSASSFDSALEINALAAVNSTGMLDITIASLWGDFYIGQSVLTVNAIDQLVSTAEVNSVPEPGILGMLGLGLIGVGIARRIAKA